MRAAFALVLILCGAGAAVAQSQADPVAYVRAIYASYERDKPAAWFDRTYSARLRKLIDADQKSAKAAGDAGKFDWDPIINAQDWKLADIKVSLVSQAGDRAVVDASFHNIDADQQMRFTLVREHGQVGDRRYSGATSRAGRCPRSLRARPTRSPTRPQNNHH